jgi:hypothetical protein
MAAGAAVPEVVVAGAEAEVGKRLRIPAKLSRSDSLHIKFIAARPLYFIFGFAIWASCDAIYFFSQPGGTHHAHSPLTGFTTENLLHAPSSQRCLLGGPQGPGLHCKSV